jgi:CheY-like chemotaxis protein
MPIETLPVGKIRILVVDGSAPDVPDLMKALAGRAGYDVQLARSGFEAGAFMQKFSPHVILVNLLTNDIDAYGLCRNIRANEDFATIKIIALANQLSTQEAAALLQRGYDGYVSNPSDTGEVIRKIEEAIAIIY